MSHRKYVLFATALLLASQSAVAQESDIDGRVSVELNAAETVEASCKLTFVITNGLEQPVDKLVYEAVLFDETGQVDRLTLFDFGSLPPARPRVRQFVVPELTCEGLGSVLFNGASTCEGADVDAGVCDTGLLATSRTHVGVSG
tara:strand:+ start:2548 stop:2979 length:432 start_codon:yes stop_codon:yes gene_type:complete